MKTKMFSVYDSKAAAYGTPFFMPMDGMATRAFQDLTNDDRSMVSKHPEDYTLWRLGEFDDELGTVSLKAEPIVCAAACVKMVVPPVPVALDRESFVAAVKDGVKEVVQ